ncbi:MAG: calcium/sodium antiporter [Defluviitaleaceae bacterium]|nr:calcium/sodium antiporter [Defluviitaleaceae bacterium]
MLLNIGLAVAGFVMLIKCADIFVDGSASLARNFKISTAIIGLTIVAFGTSAPEIAISFNSHLSGNNDLLFGNVIGSSITNILVILAVAILVKPFKIELDVIRKQIPILLWVTLGLSVLFLDPFLNGATTHSLSRADGAVLLLFFSIFVYYLITILKADKEKESLIEAPKYKRTKSVWLILLGLAGIIFGSNLVVNHVEQLATSIGISQKIISVTVISIGTSLPELVTIIVAGKKGENKMAIGSIIGGNIFNICIVLGLPILILGEAATMAFTFIDVIFMILAAVLLWLFSATSREIKRLEAIAFLAIYVAYVGYIIIQ